MAHLHEHGSVVLRSVLSQEEVRRATELFWEWLEALGSGVRRDDPSTWQDKNWPGSGAIGFCVSYGGCHSHASWFIRTRPRVKAAFASIWSTPNLIASFDTFICWRPWWSKFAQSSWTPFVENLHCDQNPVAKRGFHCVQGMVPLVDVRSDGAGGLQVVPRTNNDRTQDELASRYKLAALSGSDWLELSPSDRYVGQGQLLECRAGDLILFDSRSIHGGSVNAAPSPAFMEAHEGQLVRLAMTVTMVPKDLASPEVRAKRLGAFQNRIGLTHWPQEFNKSGFGTVAQNIVRSKISYAWPELTPEIEDLI